MAVRATAKATLPTVSDEGGVAARKVSSRTKALIVKKKTMHPSTHSKADFNKLQQKINESSLRDYKDWINTCVCDMEDAKAKGQLRTSKLYHILNKITRKSKAPPQTPTTGENGNSLDSVEEAARLWFRFLSDKFKKTDREKNRPPMCSIPSYRAPDSELTRAEFDRAVACMPDRKAVGPDGIPSEVIKLPLSPGKGSTVFDHRHNLA